jgi:hypothetical protein
MGFRIAGLGDINGDNHDDIMVSAPNWDGQYENEGAVFIWYGGPGGLGSDGNPANADWIAEGNQESWDLNGDGFWIGSTGLGRCLTAGDINGDGYADVIVGAPYYDTEREDQGRVFVYLGSETGLPTYPSWTATIDHEDAHFGSSVASCDVNGDGYSDVVVGAPGTVSSILDIPHSYGVYAWYGGPTGLGADGTATNADWIIKPEQPELPLHLFGLNVSSAGDVDGDGFDEVVVGNNCQVMVYHGAADGLPSAPSWIAGVPYALGGIYVRCGPSGDVNGDGYSDLIIGNANAVNTSGLDSRCFVWYGAPNGLGENGTPENADWVAQVTQTDALFGASVTSAGDFNGDGFNDVLVGAPMYDSGEENEGAAFIWFGGPEGLGPTGTPDNADIFIEGNQEDARFGCSVQNAGCVSGDDVDGCIVGAWRCYRVEEQEGYAFVYYGFKPFPEDFNWINSGYDWLRRGKICLEAPPEPGVDVPPEPYIPRVCPPPSWCPECVPSLSLTWELDSGSLDELLGLYAEVYQFLAPPWSRVPSGSSIDELDRVFQDLPLNRNFTEEIYASLHDALQELKANNGTVESVAASLLESVNTFDLDVRTPLLQEKSVSEDENAILKFNGVAWVSFENIAERGELLLSVTAGVPASTSDFEPGWPVATYEFDFTGKLAEGTEIDLSIYFGGFNFGNQTSTVRLLEWNGETYRDITTSVVLRTGIITGRTDKLSRYVVMAKVP